MGQLRYRTYTYVGGNPISRIDPSGRAAEEDDKVVEEGPLAGVADVQANSLIQQIRQYDPNYEYNTARPEGESYSQADIRDLKEALGQRQTSCSIYPRGPGASSGGLPPGYTPVSRWVSAAEVDLWLQNGATAIPAGIGAGGRVYVTDSGAPQPGGTDPYRIDFAVPAAALSPAGNTGWYQIFQPMQSVPIYNVTITPPTGGK